MYVGVACLLVFLVMAALMYTRRLSALLALPLMAVAIALIAGVSGDELISSILQKGSLKLNEAVITTMFGAVLAELMNKQGTARSLIRWVAEFAGDDPFTLGLILTLASALLFSTLGGLGAVIMVGTIILPVMLSLGIEGTTAGSLFLFSISLGGMFNIGSWQLYMSVLGLSQDQIISFVAPFALILASIVVGFLGLQLRNKHNLVKIAIVLAVLVGAFFLLKSGFAPTAQKAAVHPARFSIYAAAAVSAIMAIYAIARHSKNAQENPAFALIAPLIPLTLVLFCHWPFIPAFAAGIGYLTLATWKHDSIVILTRSIIDGISAVIPAIVLMLGIGMLITAVMEKSVSEAISPLLATVIPVKPISYIIGFTIMAPLALYRGPLSLWGMGSGLVALISKTTQLTSQSVMAMLLSVGQIQGICDPTNTHNIWIATYLGIDTQVLLRRTLPFAWLAVVAGLALSVSLGFTKG